MTDRRGLGPGVAACWRGAVHQHEASEIAYRRRLAGPPCADLTGRVQHMGENAISAKQILAAGEPGFDPLDLIELGKRLREATTAWKAQRRQVRRAAEATD